MATRKGTVKKTLEQYLDQDKMVLMLLPLGIMMSY